MSQVNVELNARKEMVDQPILWRLGKLYNVVVNIRRARITEDYGYVSLDIEGSPSEIEQATNYLKGLGLLSGKAEGPVNTEQPETRIAQKVTIDVRLSTVNAAQGHVPILHRVGKDYNVVVNIERAAFDDEEGGMIEITISGALLEVQRAIAYLHTTGLHVSPRQRSVTDYSNL
ncbi:MAG TPA: NIL domain-containing protein [Chthonomonadaceae bacterium]|nr:NIL domain-containing protein [Chthonomonadaceae bacterium]